MLDAGLQHTICHFSAAEAAMAKVLVIGLEPEVIDFSQPMLRESGIDAEKIRAGLKADQQKIRELGHEAAVLLVDDGATAERVVREALAADPPDIVVIGAGVRTLPAYFLLFEKLINAVHQAAPQAKSPSTPTPRILRMRWSGGWVERWHSCRLLRKFVANISNNAKHLTTFSVCRRNMTDSEGSV